MKDWKDFIECFRGIMIAPAGHGKTTAIADCLLQCPKDSCQLVLTHTHAGIASLRTKFLNKGVPTNRYHIETITGFAQRYVLSFYGASVLPAEEEKSYFSIAIEQCKAVMQSLVVQRIINLSYDGVFVDEYQDCTIEQHRMILELARNLPLHLLGDPLQGIFYFGDMPLVDFNKDLVGFQKFNPLTIPWRWHVTNQNLGEAIYAIRSKLECGEDIELQNVDDSILVRISSTEDDRRKYLQQIIKNNNNGSVLIIHPSYREMGKGGKFKFKGGVTDRIQLKQRVDFEGQFVVLDAIDSREYYACAKQIDTYISQCKQDEKTKRIAGLYDIIKKLHFKMSEINKWIDKSRNCLTRRTGDNKHLSSTLRQKFETFECSQSLSTLQAVVHFISRLPEAKCYHRDFYLTINKCFDIAQSNNSSMYNAMKLLKTRIRHQGRKVKGRCIGTTLLTKGLEFDIVILWEAHKFEDAKNFYVAISRACKKLIILTENSTLRFPCWY